MSEYGWVNDLISSTDSTGGSDGGGYGWIADIVNGITDITGNKGNDSGNSGGFDWGKLLKGGLDAGEIILALMTANEASKGTTKEDWKAANPSYNNPFGSITSDWNGGNPIISQELSPEVQGIVDSLIIDQLQTERTPYGMPNAMRDIYDSNLNWQRERYGLDPVENASGQPDSFTGGSEPADELVGGDAESEPVYKPKYQQRDYDDIGTRLGDTYKDAGLRGGDSTTYDEFKLRDQYADGYNRYMDSSNMGFGYNGYGKPIAGGGQNTRGQSGIGQWFDTRFGDSGGYIGYDDVNRALQGETAGKGIGAILAALGIPFAGAGMNWLTNANGVLEDYVGQLEPREGTPEYEALNPNNIAPAQQPFVPDFQRDFNSMRNGRNNSIAGNGAYGYATRLRPRGGYFDDTRIVAPRPDKIGEV